MNIKIIEVTHYKPGIEIAINFLLQQLTGKEGSVTPRQIEEIVLSPNSHLFIAENEASVCMGMISIGIYVTPTGRKAWIEDVVVDENFRGQGVGEALTRFAINVANEKNAEAIMLTSQPTRASANRLYRRVGFEPKETNL